MMPLDVPLLNCCNGNVKNDSVNTCNDLLSDIIRFHYRNWSDAYSDVPRSLLEPIAKFYVSFFEAPQQFCILC